MATEDASKDQQEVGTSGACEQHQNSFAMQPFQRTKQSNTLYYWGNKETMNLNHLVLENILLSPYFKNTLFQLKTYHEVIDEIFYNVQHLEPWEKGTRRTTGQTGMCGGVRGVGAGGVVSSAYCLLYKLFTLKLTRKQVTGLLNHADSCYIRGLGFMYIRYCLHPNTFWDWYEPYLDDDEEVDPKAGGGDAMTIGQMVKLLLTKLEWYCTLFPRIPVPIQKDIESKLREHNRKKFAETDSPREDLDKIYPEEKNHTATAAEKESEKFAPRVEKVVETVRHEPRTRRSSHSEASSLKRKHHRSRSRSHSASVDRHKRRRSQERSHLQHREDAREDYRHRHHHHHHHSSGSKEKHNRSGSAHHRRHSKHGRHREEVHRNHSHGRKKSSTGHGDAGNSGGNHTTRDDAGRMSHAVSAPSSATNEAAAEQPNDAVGGQDAANVGDAPTTYETASGTAPHRATSSETGTKEDRSESSLRDAAVVACIQELVNLTSLNVDFHVASEREDGEVIDGENDAKCLHQF